MSIVLHLSELIVSVDDLAEKTVFPGAVEATHQQKQKHNSQGDSVVHDHLLKGVSSIVTSTTMC